MLDSMKEYLLISLPLLPITHNVKAQYFGRNKVQYEDSDFKEMITQNFHIYFYPAEEKPVADAARMLERWNIRIGNVLNYRLSKTQPIIIYANHADFQQTIKLFEGLLILLHQWG